jgi:hypothetical protein
MALVRSIRLRGRRVIAGLAGMLALALVAGPAAARAQHADPAAGLFVNSEVEQYVRLLQGRGLAPLHLWSIRSFSWQEAERVLPADTVHPWRHWVRDREEGLPDDRIMLLPVETALYYNSAFPYGRRDGPVWAGRGMTAAVEAGVAARHGPLSLVLAPVVYHSRNADFPLAHQEWDWPLGSPLADARWPHIDFPQRFGNEPFTRLDPGQSTLRIDAGGVAAGLSTANQHWGPAISYPMILGNDAPGFLHAFLGSARPVNVGIGRLHGRGVGGRLEQSAYSPIREGSGLRFMNGVVASFSPRGLEGLELGGTRFFHLLWDTNRNYFKFLESMLARRLENPHEGDEVDNQLASVFARWVLPGSGLEIYGEIAREDFNYDFRDLVLEPDHDIGYTLGFQKSWRAPRGALGVVRGEVMNSVRSHLLLVRPQTPFFIHLPIRQGHTHRGQMLGATAVYGGAGATLAADLYHPRGRWTLEWSRELRRELDEGIVPDDPTGDFEVLHALRAEALVLLGRFHLTTAVAGISNLNRDFRGDVFNLNAMVTLRAALP